MVIEACPDFFSNEVVMKTKSIVFYLFLILSLAAPSVLWARSGPPPKTKAKPTPVLKLHFDDPSYDYELKRNMSYAVSHGADINESLAAAQNIVPGQGDTWYKAWHKPAARLEALAAKALAEGRKQTAREALLRASNYHRSAEFFLHGKPKDARIMASWRASRRTFRQAAKLLDHPIEPVSIPYGPKKRLPGYLLKPDDSGKPRKTLLLQTGFDGTGEELYLDVGWYAVKRGYNVLIFEGPGQGGALREGHLYFRPDWERVVTPVVDYTLTRPCLDPNRLALMGLSMGGYLAPRAAAFEHRLAALVANPGAFDMYGSQRPSQKEWAKMNQDPAITNQLIRSRMAGDIGFRWWINNGMFTTGRKTPLDFMRFWSRFTLTDKIAAQIKCPTLVIVGAGDHFNNVATQKVLYEKLTAPKTLLTFGPESPARQHCQVGAVLQGNAAIFDWLDATLK
jgi:alpha-beta hydrolase superfamily lysophospholipase